MHWPRGPGRIDQAIEFPLPDEEGRAKLVKLYSQGVEVPDAVTAQIVKRTEPRQRGIHQGIDAAFGPVSPRTQWHGANRAFRIVENALEEMLFSGGSLNLKLLGAEGAQTPGNGVTYTS